MGHDYGWHSSPSLPRVHIPPPLITPPPLFRTGPHIPMSPATHVPYTIVSLAKVSSGWRNMLEAEFQAG